MPKSKRSKSYELTRTKKAGFERKTNQVQEVRSCVDRYKFLFVFSVENMRNTKLKEVRGLWKDSRFFLGKNKVTKIALGCSLEDELKPELSKISSQLVGDVGLFFTNNPLSTVIKWFNGYSEIDHARSGNIATSDFIIEQGNLEQFPHNMEPQLRKLGLQTTLEKGVVTMVTRHEVCKQGDTLNPEQCRILKLFNMPMVSFHINLLCYWSDGHFYEISPSLCKNISEFRDEATMDDNNNNNNNNDDDDDDDDNEFNLSSLLESEDEIDDTQTTEKIDKIRSKEN